MNQFRKKLLILCLLVPLTVLAWMALPRTAGAEQGGAVTPELHAVAETESDSVVSRVFINMINRSIERMNDGEDPEEEDRLLKEYPMEERPLAEYGDSPRLRILDETGNGGETNYLVYRESILVIPQGEAAEYTVTYSGDRRTATLTPAVPAEELAGRTGVVLAGDTITDDTVLIFDGEPEEEGGSLTIPLADTDSLTMVQLFSDGRLDFSPAAAMTGGSEKADGQAGGTGENGKALSITNPLRKDVSGTNWSGRVYDFLPDLSNCDLDTDISLKPWSFRFNVVLYLAVKGKFELTSTGSSGGKEEVEIGSINIPLPASVTLKMKYTLVVSFDETPVHVAGSIFNRIGWSFGIGPAYLKDYTSDVDYTTFEVGRNGSWFTDPRYANKDINLYIGSKFDYTGGFLGLHVPIIDVDIGPVISLTMSFTTGTYTRARWEKDLLDPDRPADRTQPSIHICTENGKDGCLSVKGTNRGSYSLSGKVDVLVKSWKIPLKNESEKFLKSAEWYNSLTNKTGLQKGACPHLWYRVPVRVWYDRVGGRPADGFVVYPSWSPADTRSLSRDTTKNGGKAYIYLPYQARTRYEIVAFARADGTPVLASAYQPSDMRRGDNDTVNIVLDMEGNKELSVQVQWDVDADALDIPAEVLVEVQRWNGERWEIADDLNGYPASVILHGAPQKHENWYTRISMPKYEAVGGEFRTVQYRIRALNNDYATVHDAEDSDLRPGESPDVVYHVGSGLDRNGGLVPDHDTKYMAEYSVQQYPLTESTLIRFTALYDVNLYKRWENIPEEERPDEVFLALLSRTDPSWGVGANYTLVTDPVRGSTITLAEIVSLGEMDLDLPHIPERKVAVCRATYENGWSGSFTIRKYKNGIPQEYMASELNGDIVNRLMDNEYLLETTVHMDEHEYLSVSGAARPVYNDYTLTATVINIGDGGDRHTIGGVKYWVPDEDFPSYPAWIKLHIWEDNGSEVKEIAAITLNRPDQNAPVSERVMWPWQLTDPAIDTAINTYTVTEEFPADYADAGRYYAEVYGTDIVNRWTWTGGCRLRIQKVFDRDYAPVNDWPTVFVTLKTAGQGGETTERIALEEYENYTWTRMLPAGITPEQAMAAYSIEEDIAKLNSDTWVTFIPVYSGIDVRIINQIPVYTLTVTNMLQRDVVFRAVKEWILGPNKEGYSEIPDSLNIVLTRDGLEINRLTLAKPPESAFSKSLTTGNYFCLLANNRFTTDADGNPLKRIADDGHLYVYEVEELPFPGMAGHGGDDQDGAFVEEIVQSNNTHTSEPDVTWYYTYAFVNRWVNGNNEEYVSLKGKKTWSEKDDNTAYRPNRINISVINHHDELVRTLTVTEADGWAWYVSGLPRYETDDEGNRTEIMYYVAESEIPGYSAAYSADFDPVTKTWSNYDEQTGTWTNYDEQTKTWTCDVTNTLTGNFVLKVKKEVKGTDSEGLQEPFKFKITAMDEDEAPGRKFPMPQEAGTDGTFTITGAGEQQLSFLFSEDGIYTYRITEEKGDQESWIYDEHSWIAIIVVAPKMDAEGNVSDTEKDIRCFLYDESNENDDEEDGSGSGSSQGSGEGQPFDINLDDPQQVAELDQQLPESDTVTFTNTVSNTITVKKEWDIDIEKKDHPETIEAVIQSKEDSDGKKWKTVEKIELGKTKDDEGNETESWEKTVQVPKYRKKEGSAGQEEITYRVRELGPKSGLLFTLQDLANEYAGKAKDKFDEWIGKLKQNGKSWINELPEEIRNAAEEGYDKLAEKLGATEDDIFSKLMEKIQFAKDEDRIVFDKDDKDKPEKQDGEEKEPETNAVAYKVPSYTSVLSGEVDGHETKYKVSYKNEDSTYTITNLAITEIELTKRWFIPGGDDDDKPESAWVVLLFNVDPEVLDKAGSLPGAGELISKVKDIQLPLFKLTSLLDDFNNLIDGGINPVNLLSELALGIDLDVFGLAEGIKVSVAKVDEDSKWATKFTAKKYTLGFPVEYMGAELSSEILRQLVKYIFHINIQVSWTPFGNYISIPGKAYGNLADASTIMGLFDLNSSSLSGKITEALMEFILDQLNDLISELVPDGLPIALDDWEMAANVINVKIKIPDIPDTLEIRKHWAGRDDMEIPDSISLEVEMTMKDGTTKTETIVLKKEDYKGSTEWTLDLNEYMKGKENGNSGENNDDDDDDEDPVEDASILSETLPDGFAGKYDQDIDGLEVTNTWITPGKVTVYGKKVWDDDDDRDGKRPEKVTVKLLANGSPATPEGLVPATSTDLQPISVETTGAAGWKFSFPDLPEKDGNGQKINYSVEEEPVDGYVTTISGPETGNATVKYTITNKHEPEKATDVKVKKEWDDNNNQDGIRPDKVRVQLLCRATPTDLDSPYNVATATDLSEANHWEYTFTDLNKNDHGKELTYRVDEEVVEGYDKEITGPEDDGGAAKYTITNRHVTGTISVAGKKTWSDDDNEDGYRPDSITVILMRNGTKADSRSVSALDNWEYCFANLDEKENGADILWEIREYPVPEHYEAAYSDPVKSPDGKTITINITNTQKTVDVSGVKYWDDMGDNDGIRPDSITAVLYANGVMTDQRKTVTAADKWTYTFTAPKFDGEGKRINYSAFEDPIPGGYYSQPSGMNITNTHAPETIEISGVKTWDDDGDRDGRRPQSIVVTLSADGVQVKRQTVTPDAQGNWTYSFRGLRKYKENGKEIVYTVSEEYVSGYVMRISGTDITNTHVPETTTISGEKFWDDDNDRDQIRPSSITVILSANGQESARKTVTADGDGRWLYSFENVPVYYDHGKPVSYLVSEEEVPDYRMVISGYNITNVHVPGTVIVRGQKIWDDEDNADRRRPSAVIVNLLADGVQIASRVVTAETNWKYRFYDLPKKDNGRDIVYTVKEEPVSDYISIASGRDIINTPVKAIYRLEWYYQRNGQYPDEPNVTAEQLGVVGRKVEATEADKTPNRANYFLDENAENIFAGLVRADGTLTLKIYFCEGAVVEGRKIWDDADDQDRIRPESVTVKLLKNGTGAASAEITAENGWAFSFTNLPKAENGTAIRYTVKEDPVPDGYTSETDGYEITNRHVPESTRTYTITFDPNGGTLDGSTEPVTAEYAENEVITIREAPVRNGYTFLYWKGSRYDPGDEYTVTEDHTFVAQWESPYTYRFAFTKKWSGGHENSIDWTLYNPDGTVAHKKFNKTVISPNEWYYEAWFAEEKGYYIVEKVPAGYKVRYENTGAYADVMDRCCNGGTIINYKIPKTGDNGTPAVLWIGCMLLGLLGAGCALYAVKRRKGR